MNSRPSQPDLTVFVPTRSRPKNIRDFAGTFCESLAGFTDLIFVLDDDDPDLAQSIKRIANDWDYEVVSSVNRGMVEGLNTAFCRRRDEGTLGFAVGFMGDDHRPRSWGWDLDYIDVLKDIETGFVYGNDLLQGGIMPTQVAFTTDIAVTLGWMAPPVLHHLCVDLVWRELGNAIGRLEYLDDVIVEHMHPLAGKARMDRGYRIANSTVMARHDTAAYELYMGTDFSRDVEKLKGLL